MDIENYSATGFDGCLFSYRREYHEEEIDD